MYIYIYIHRYACDGNRLAQALCVSVVGVLKASGLTGALIAATFGALTPAYMPTLHANPTSAPYMCSQDINALTPAHVLPCCRLLTWLACALDAAVDRDAAVSSMIVMRPFAHLLSCAPLHTLAFTPLTHTMPCVRNTNRRSRHARQHRSACCSCPTSFLPMSCHRDQRRRTCRRHCE